MRLNVVLLTTESSGKLVFLSRDPAGPAIVDHEALTPKDFSNLHQLLSDHLLFIFIVLLLKP